MQFIHFNDIISVLLEVFQTFFHKTIDIVVGEFVIIFFLLNGNCVLHHLMYHPSYSELICVCTTFANEPIMMNYSYSNIKFAFASFLHFIKFTSKFNLKLPFESESSLNTINLFLNYI